MSSFALLDPICLIVIVSKPARAADERDRRRRQRTALCRGFRTCGVSLSSWVVNPRQDSIRSCSFMMSSRPRWVADDGLCRRWLVNDVAGPSSHASSIRPPGQPPHRPTTSKWVQRWTAGIVGWFAPPVGELHRQLDVVDARTIRFARLRRHPPSARRWPLRPFNVSPIPGMHRHPPRRTRRGDVVLDDQDASRTSRRRPRRTGAMTRTSSCMPTRARRRSRTRADFPRGADPGVHHRRSITAISVAALPSERSLHLHRARCLHMPSLGQTVVAVAEYCPGALLFLFVFYPGLIHPTTGRADDAGPGAPPAAGRPLRQPRQRLALQYVMKSRANNT